jgi:hypothetical protein
LTHAAAGPRVHAPRPPGQIGQEPDRLGDNDLVRVIDALGVRKGVDGEVEVLHNSQLGADRQAGFGALVGGLIGLGAAGEEGVELGAERERPAGGWPRSSSAPLDLVAIGLTEAEPLASVDSNAL